MSSSLVTSSLSRRLCRLTLTSNSTRSVCMNNIMIAPRTSPFAIDACLSGNSFSTMVTSTTTPSSSYNIRVFPSNQLATVASQSSLTILRSMATNRKVIDAKNAKRLKIQQKKKKNKPGEAASTKDRTTSPSEASDTNQPFLQHQEWVKFQQSISVEGFQTGQTVTATVLKKSRGGKQARRKREKELARLGAGSTGTTTYGDASATTTKFPAIRYSVEETQELLKQAYAALPERAGKRGNRNLRRQANRWKVVRDGRSQYKKYIILAHERRMEHRKYKRDRVVLAKDDAPVQRQKDVEYQAKVLKMWAQKMYGIGQGIDNVDPSNERTQVATRIDA